MDKQPRKAMSDRNMTMQNYKTIKGSNGNLMTIKTDEPVTRTFGDDLIVGTVFNIEVLEAEFARVKLLNPLSDEPRAWECNESVRCCAEDITDEPERAAKLIRESDRLASYWLHLFHIHEGEKPAGTPFDENEWAENYARRQARDAQNRKR